MIVCKRRRNDNKPLSTIVTTLGGLYRPDPVIPDSMLALLRTLDVTSAYVIASKSGQTPPAL